MAHCKSCWYWRTPFPIIIRIWKSDSSILSFENLIIYKSITCLQARQILENEFSKLIAIACERRPDNTNMSDANKSWYYAPSYYTESPLPRPWQEDFQVQKKSSHWTVFELFSFNKETIFNLYFFLNDFPLFLFIYLSFVLFAYLLIFYRFLRGHSSQLGEMCRVKSNAKSFLPAAKKLF